MSGWITIQPDIGEQVGTQQSSVSIVCLFICGIFGQAHLATCRMLWGVHTRFIHKKTALAHTV
jgi:hypothetical protein